VEDLAARVAVITGGGSGIGRALVLACAGAGMHCVVADVDTDAASRVATEATDTGVRALAVACDVADRSSVDALAAATLAEFGGAHLLVNNAGVLILGRVRDMIVEDWQWIFSVNVMGVAHGIHAFLPQLLARAEAGEGAHVVNVASVAGFGGGGVYGASKAAVLTISESLRDELAESGVGVTAVMPGNVNSRILGAQRNRPATFGRHAPEPFGNEVTNFGVDPEFVAERVLDAVRRNEPYAFAMPPDFLTGFARRFDERFTALRAAVNEGAVGPEVV
jgi:NAD(P)-dependent dehydrogenase (short-subunit alcohol dehydrogenase family)